MEVRGAWVIAGVLLAALGAEAEAQHAHSHGVARLAVALDAGKVTLRLESPLDGLIGFEHRPRTPAQQAAVASLQERMRSAHELFRFDAAAACTLTSSAAESAIFRPPSAQAAKEEHADLDATFEFACASPERLRTLEVGLFATYPRLQRLGVEVVTAKGQSRRDLKRPATTVPLRP